MKKSIHFFFFIERQQYSEQGKKKVDRINDIEYRKISILTRAAHTKDKLN